MKKQLIILLFPLVGMAQKNIDLNIGIGNVAGLGISYKNCEVQALTHLSNKVRYPFVVVNANYHIGFLYAGIGTEGISAGIKFKKNRYTFSTGIAGNYGYAILGVSSLGKVQVTDINKKVTDWLTVNDVACALLESLAGYWEGEMDAISQHQWGKGNPDIDIDLAWKNKWKNGDPAQGEKFWGSSRWFVGLTQDRWHQDKLKRNAAHLLTTTLCLMDLKNGWKHAVVKTVALAIINRTAFELTYKK